MQAASHKSNGKKPSAVVQSFAILDPGINSKKMPLANFSAVPVACVSHVMDYHMRHSTLLAPLVCHYHNADDVVRLIIFSVQPLPDSSSVPSQPRQSSI